jgi:hypothetical protein
MIICFYLILGYKSLCFGLYCVRDCRAITLDVFRGDVGYSRRGMFTLQQSSFKVALDSQRVQLNCEIESEILNSLNILLYVSRLDHLKPWSLFFYARLNSVRLNQLDRNGEPA